MAQLSALDTSVSDQEQEQSAYEQYTDLPCPPQVEAGGLYLQAYNL